MAGAIVKVDSTELQEAIDKAKKACVNLRPAFDQMGEHMLGSIEENFAAQGRPERWKRLSMATIWGMVRGKKGHNKRTGALKVAAQRKIVGKKILTSSGRLRRSITYRAGSKSLLVGTNLIYGAIHHFGGEAGRKSARVDIPARPYLVVQEEDKAAMVDIIERHIGGEFK